MQLRRTLLLSAFIVIAAAPVYAAPLAMTKSVLDSSGEPTTPSVTFDSRSGFIVTWQEREAGGARLMFAVIDTAGKELRRAVVAAGKNWFVNWADFPSLVVLDNGDWVTHWLEKSAESNYAYDIRITRSRDQGRTWGAPITPHRDRTPTEHGFVSLVPKGKDQVLVVWLDGRKSLATTHASADRSGHGSGAHHEVEGVMTLRSAVLDREGTITEERELDETTCSCCQTDAARSAAGTRVVYRDRSAAEIRDIATVTRSEKGEWSAPRIVHADQWRIEGCPVNGPALAVNGKRELIVWPTGASGATRVHYLVRESDRILARGEIDPESRMLGRLDAAAWGSGFLASWIGTNESQSGLLVAEINAAGTLSTPVNVAPVLMTRLSGNPRIAASGGRALIVWAEPAAGRGHRVSYAVLSRN